MELAYKQYGNPEGEHLLILHGLFGTLDNWHTLATFFGQKYTVWAIDLRNHGRSPHSEEFNYQIMANDIRDFMVRHNIPIANIIGHSMGGKVAMQFSFLYPEKILKLIVADIAPRGYGASHNELIDALHSLDLSKIKRRTDAEAMLSLTIKEQGVMLFLLKNLTREGDSYKWKMNLQSITDNYDAIIGPIDLNAIFDKPTLFIRGERSNYIASEDEAQIKKQFPHSRILTIQEAGHWVHADAPQQFLTATEDFLAEN